MEEPRLAEWRFAVATGDRVIVIDRVRVDVSRVWNLHRTKFPIDQLEGTGGEPGVGESSEGPDNGMPLVDSVQVSVRSGANGVLYLYCVVSTLDEAMKIFVAEITNGDAGVINHRKPIALGCDCRVVIEAHAPVGLALEPA